MLEPTRRGFIKGLGLLVAAPAIVRASSLMPVRRLSPRLIVGLDMAYGESVSVTEIWWFNNAEFFIWTPCTQDMLQHGQGEMPYIIMPESDITDIG